jgi:hypothetical protein
MQTMVFGDVSLVLTLSSQLSNRHLPPKRKKCGQLAR